MIDPKKVSETSKRTLFEQNEGRTALQLKLYIEDSPPISSIGRNALAGMLLYLLVLLIVILGAFDEVSRLREQVGDLGLAIFIVITLAVFTILYIIISDLVYRKKFEKVRTFLSRYRRQSIRMEKAGGDIPDAAQPGQTGQKQDETFG